MPDIRKYKYLRFLVHIKNFFNLISDANRQGTIDSIGSDIYIRGANVWYLICSALIASIGLDTNSPAVIIGAMLISPLMAPILGVGLSLGIHDKETFFTSVKQFAIAVIGSLLVSSIYFLITPLGNATSEILARTKPTILDVGVAFFGGVAGIVAGSRTKAAAAIPGVAIATALMPPICTAGFGLATARWDIFFGGIYLFFINAVFISFSSYIMVRLMKFPFKEYVDSKVAARVKRVMITTIILITVPSILIFFQIINEVRLKNRINTFISRYIESPERKVIDWKLSVGINDSNQITIFTVGNKISDEKTDSLNTALNESVLKKSRLKLLQYDASSGFEKYLREEIKSDILQTVEIKDQQEKELEKKLRTAEEKLKKNELDSLKYEKASKELKILYPEIEKISFSIAHMVNYSVNDTSMAKFKIPSIMLQWKKSIPKRQAQQNIRKIEKFLTSRLDVDTVQVVIIENR